MVDKYIQRCQDCVALVEGDCGEWICDYTLDEIHDIEDCPEGLELGVIITQLSRDYGVIARTEHLFVFEMDKLVGCYACKNIDRFSLYILRGEVTVFCRECNKIVARIS